MNDWNIELDRADTNFTCPGCAEKDVETPIEKGTLERVRNRGISYACRVCLKRFKYVDLLAHQTGGKSRLVVHGDPDPLWLEETIKKLDGRPVILSVSGGKDSTAVALLLKEVGIPYEAIHFDTGWEHPLTEAYVRETLPDIIGPIKIMQGRFSGFAEMVKKKGMFPSRVRRFCTQELKVKPFITYLKQRQLDGDDPVSAVGIRAAESQARSTLEEWEENESYDCEVWRPIIAWSEQDVIDMHAKHGIIPNPLYLKGARRVGCWPCIFSAKKEIRLLAQIDPKRTAEIEALEAEVQESARARYAARGETFESLGYAPPTMFMPSSGGSNMPFSEVVAWSKTARGGEYLDPKQTDARAGCMRWGLCDVVNLDDEEDDAGAVHDGPVPDLAEDERCE